MLLPSSPVHLWLYSSSVRLVLQHFGDEVTGGGGVTSFVFGFVIGLVVAIQ